MIERRDDGPAGDAVLLRNGARGRQPRTGRQPALHDREPDLIVEPTQQSGAVRTRLERKSHGGRGLRHDVLLKWLNPRPGSRSADWSTPSPPPAYHTGLAAVSSGLSAHWPRTGAAAAQG